MGALRLYACGEYVHAGRDGSAACAKCQPIDAAEGLRIAAKVRRDAVAAAERQYAATVDVIASAS